MAEFVVELYVPKEDRAAAESSAERNRIAAEALAREGIGVRYLRTIFLPDDETCFHLYEGPSVEAVREAARRAGVAFARIAEAVDMPNGSKEGLPQ